MTSLQQRLQHRYPDWFRGHRAHVVRPLLKTLGRRSRWDTIDAFLSESSHLRGFAFVSATIAHRQLDARVDDADLQRILPSGRLLIVASRPSGARDAMALLDMVGRVGRDVRIVANDMLALLEPLAALLLPVRVSGGSAVADSVRAIERALEDEQCVIVFPAGEVSRLGVRGVRDARWHRGFLRLARRTATPVLTVRVEARNSTLFYRLSALCRPASTALLAREAYARRRHPLRLHVGEAKRLADDEASDVALRRVRRALYALRSDSRDDDAYAGPQPLAAAVDPVALWMAIECTDRLGETCDGKQIRLARCAPDSILLQEIGRLRERTFRAVGEGTGRARDLDAYDAHYQHIVLWDAARRQIVGAYRVARGAAALARAGLAGLYTASLFAYADDAIPRLAEGMELGRSFVVQEYWGSRSLDYLWQGIGAYLQRHPQVRYLFGAVSISAALPRDAREQLVAYYQHYFGSRDALATSRRPFAYFAAPPSFGALDAAAALGVLKANLSAIGASVPVLYKQYTELCEPGGVRFLAFGIDPDFSDSIDGLIETDLQRIRPHKRNRYLRTATAALA